MNYNNYSVPQCFFFFITSTLLSCILTGSRRTLHITYKNTTYSMLSPIVFFFKEMSTLPNQAHCLTEVLLFQYNLAHDGPSIWWAKKFSKILFQASSFLCILNIIHNTQIVIMGISKAIKLHKEHYITC